MPNHLTPYHAKYFAHELSILRSSNGVDRLSQALFDASVDLNPHQIEAALFALCNPLNKGVVLADEVGLGKTIEAGLVLSQLWAERKRKLLIIAPASLRLQWSQELLEKFNLPTCVLDAKTFKALQEQGIYNPLNHNHIVVISYHYALKIEDQLAQEAWDLVVIDEAHKLRNAHKEHNRIGQTLKRCLNGRKKLLLTATPLQNSLIELYGLSSLIDDQIFGDEKSFRKQFMYGNCEDDLKHRLAQYMKRTLRKDVLEYVKYTKRQAITIPFTPSPQEQALYDSVSDFLEQEESYALPKQQKHLIGLILRKLLASSSCAVLYTLSVMQARLKALKSQQGEEQGSLLKSIIDHDELAIDLLEEEDIGDLLEEREATQVIYQKKIDQEIEQLEGFIQQAESITVDAKAESLLIALETGFEKLAMMGAEKKVIVFTESKRTQAYLKNFLDGHGYQGKIVTFSGSNTHHEATDIYQNWKLSYQGSDKVTGSPQIDRRTALIDYFKDHAEIMIATEAAAEGVNLQFCSLLVNYDLPWNPQRVEQRIGRCHRYGQKFDVVVINFVNQKNVADIRVLELLTEKFSLFDGVFGASDSVLGQITQGFDFEKRIESIYQKCRLPKEIDQAFAQLQKDLEQEINLKMEQTKKALLDHFDEDVHDKLKIKLQEAKQRLDKVGRWFWQVTKHELKSKAKFNDLDYSFTLTEPVAKQHTGHYQLIRKAESSAADSRAFVGKHTQTYRMTHPLGEHVIHTARQAPTSKAQLTFNYSAHSTKLSAAKSLQGQSGWLSLNLLHIQALQDSEYLIFTGLTDQGQVLDEEDCRKLFNISATVQDTFEAIPSQLVEYQSRHIDATLASVMDANQQFFHDEKEKLEKWVDDKIATAEQALDDTRKQIKSVQRESRRAFTPEAEKKAQEQLKLLERKKKQQRAEIWDVEDEVSAKRDEFIQALEARMKQKTHVAPLFTIRWQII